MGFIMTKRRQLPQSVRSSVNKTLKLRAGESANGADLSGALRYAFRHAPLSEQALRSLAGTGRSLPLQALSNVLPTYQTKPAIWLLVSGRVSVGCRDACGRWWQSRLVEAGEWIDVISAWSGASVLEEANAEIDSVVHEFLIEDLELLYGGHASLPRQLLACVANQARQTIESSHAFLTQGIRVRLAGWMLKMQSHAGGSSEFSLPQFKKDIASQLGVTAETFSRTLREFVREEIIAVARYRIQIRNPDLLRQLAYG